MKFYIDKGLVQTIEALNKGWMSSVFDCQVGDIIPTVGVYQGYPVSHCCSKYSCKTWESLFNQNPVLVTMRTLWTDWQTVQMHKGWTDKSKIMVNTTMSGVQLEEVHSFKYVGTTFSEDGSCTADIHIRISMATAAVGKLNSWDNKNIRFIFKYRLYKFPIIPYAVQLWDVNLVCQDGQRIHAFETKLLRRLLHITYKDCSSNDFLWCTVTTLVGPQENLLITVKWHKLVWFDHDIRHKNLWQQVPLDHPHRWAS